MQFPSQSKIEFRLKSTVNGYISPQSSVKTVFPLTIVKERGVLAGNNGKS